MKFGFESIYHIALIKDDAKRKRISIYNETENNIDFKLIQAKCNPF